MWLCCICRFNTELDDALVTTVQGRCICLRCFSRETGNARPLPPALRRELTATLTALEAA